ncbi:hypothetical protein [Streptomyces sp. NPDC002550]
MFHPEDITPVDPHEYIRREQARFFKGGVYDSKEVASQIALEALLLGVSDVHIVENGDWITVSSESDWLAEMGEDVFHRLTPIRTGGQNAATSEVLLTVFSPGVVTAKNGEAVIIKGDSLGPLADNVPERGRIVAFKKSPENG